jgi:hypothetical protein
VSMSFLMWNFAFKYAAATDVAPSAASIPA